jgi:hypothetical protein
VTTMAAGAALATLRKNARREGEIPITLIATIPSPEDNQQLLDVHRTALATRGRSGTSTRKQA